MKMLTKKVNLRGCYSNHEWTRLFEERGQVEVDRCGGWGGLEVFARK